jgi:Holliday junction resolvase RusA-like endonuclease
MDQVNRAERVVALTAIRDKAKDLIDSGMDDIGVETFVQGAKKKLAQERPDRDNYMKAALAARMAQG